MIYTLEYLNEDAELIIIRYDVSSKTIEKMRPNISSVGYVEPTNGQIFFCAETEDKVTMNGVTGSWSQKIAGLSVEHEETGDQNAFGFIDTLISEEKLIPFMEELITNHKTNQWDHGKERSTDDIQN